MSTALAIAAVSAVLKDLLNNGLIDNDLTNIGNVAVTALPPDRVVTTDTTQPSQLNLFLYHVTPNAGWRNVGLPSRDSSGERLSNPPLALDLHYLLTAYGKQDFHSEILLGYGMQLLHETPVLTRGAIRAALNPPVSINGIGSLPILQTLSKAGLDEQIEQIIISLESLSTEEMSKLWTAFQTHYRPTAAYHVSVVLIESSRSTKSSLPVRQRNLLVLPFSQLRVTDVLPNIVTSGSTLIIQGQNLKADTVVVRFGTTEVNSGSISDRQIEVPVPTGLQAGVNTVQVVHPLNFGTPSDPHEGFESNVAAFILRPTINKNPDGTYKIAVSPEQTHTKGAFRTLTVELSPSVGQSQRVLLLLNQRNPASNAPAKAYSFNANPRTSDTHGIDFVIRGVSSGDYLVRVQVDGAESLPDVDTDPKSPSFNQYTGTPNVTL